MSNPAVNKITLFDKNILFFAIYSLFMLILIMETPNKLNYISEHFHILSIVGGIGLFRYGLWIVHLVRAQIYENHTYTQISKQANQLRKEEWKPNRLYFMLASYGEDRKILQNSIKSIVQEAKNLNLPVTICMGTANPHDEEIVSSIIRNLPYGHKVDVTFIRQNKANKRLQIGGALRALTRKGLSKEDSVIFMDGDSIIIQGCLEKCLRVLTVKPDVQAITTNEKAIVRNSGILSNMMNLRFAIRNLHMNSLALSNKVLCLTGRFSVFRAEQILNEEFISRIENDYIEDWYWNKIKFLSGDDKSTWFSLLKNGAKMLYVPDALIYSIERFDNNPLRSYVATLKRWSGNMLRNNNRALALGPKKLGIFPWFILFDQRISMWTAMISPSIIVLSLFKDIQLSFLVITWVLFVKYLQSLIIFYYGRAINWTFPILYYLHQFGNALVKIYTLFHLGIQKWNHNRQVNYAQRDKFYFGFAKYVTGLYIVIFILFINILVN